jgi:hypothetical protein
LLQSIEDPPRLEITLGWGCYSLQVRDVTGVEGRAPGRQAITALLNSWRVAQRADGQEARALDAQELRLIVNENRFRLGAPSESSSVSDVRVSTQIVERVPEDWTLTLPANSSVMVTVVPERARIASAARPVDSSRERTASGEGRNQSQGVPLQLALFSATDPRTPVASSPSSGRLTHDVRESGAFTIRVSGDPAAQESAAGRTVGLLSLNLAVVSKALAPPATLPAALLENGMTAPRDPTSGAWQFDRVPASFTFRVEAVQEVVARLPTVSVPNPFAGDNELIDLVLFLDRGINQLEQNDSDPEEIVRTLEPGEYTFRIELLGGGTREIGFATLDLEFRAAQTAAPPAPAPRRR